jgi:myo-inositol-1(or 4)-monophosphatase
LKTTTSSTFPQLTTIFLRWLKLADAGTGLKELWGQVGVLKTKDGIRDVLTRADLEAERRLVEIIRARFPDHHILTEESGRMPSPGESPYRWILDPLDGTTNYLHQVPVRRFRARKRESSLRGGLRPLSR